jgi:flagellar biosynthesis/type III secretory pathway M-ring protein FliF/YscJ
VKEISPPPMPGSRPPPPSGPSTCLLDGDMATQTRAVGDHYMVSKYVYGLQAENVSVLEAFCVHLREQGNEEVANAVAAQVAFYRMIGQ